VTGRGARAATPLTVALAVAVGTIALAVAAPAEASSDLPPPNRAALAQMFRDELKPLGLRVSRGLLQNPDTYKEDPNGTHLALYLTPTSSQYVTADYVRNFARITRVFVPMVFHRWPALQSFDICQEPANDPRDEPPPVTQIYVTRTALDRVGSWKHASLPDLLAASPKQRQRGGDYSVYFDGDVLQDPAFQKAADAVGYPTAPDFG
jgi:hypothetical protein